MNVGRATTYEVWAIPDQNQSALPRPTFPRRLQVVDEEDTDERINVIASNWKQDELFAPGAGFTLQVVRVVTTRSVVPQD